MSLGDYEEAVERGFAGEKRDERPNEFYSVAGQRTPNELHRLPEWRPNELDAYLRRIGQPVDDEAEDE